MTTAALPRSSPSRSLPRRVLALIDDHALRETLVRGLGRHGMEVVAVSSLSGLKALETHTAPDAGGVHVVLVDVPQGAPTQSLALLERLRGEGNAIPAVCLVSPSDSAAVSRRNTDGRLVAIVKPIDLAELASDLQRLAKGDA